MNLNFPEKHSHLPDSYKKVRHLGSGGFAQVYEYLDIDSNSSLAIKIIEKKSLSKPRILQKLISEIKIHKSLSHSHIVKLHSSLEDSEHVYILLELCCNNSLSDLLKRRKRLSEREVRHYVFQLLLAIEYLHSLHILHRDIKLANVLIDEKMDVKIADFGLASKIEYPGERKRTICGTPNYIAPEVLEGNHSYEADVWSVGVLVFTLLVGYPPFQTDSVKQTYRRIKKSHFTFPEHLALSNSSKDLIKRILVTSPEKRIPLRTIFEHDFFVKEELPTVVPLSALAVPPFWDDQMQTKESDDASTSGSEGVSETLTVERFILHTTWLGYILSDGTCGCYFLDGGSIIASTDEFLWVDKKKSRFSYLKYPRSLGAKVSVAKYLISFFRSQNKDSVQNGVFVKRWVKKDHANIFQLSNKTLQLIFTDTSQIIVAKGQQEVVYLNKFGEKSVHNFNALTEITNKDLITRIRYTHSVIKSL